MLRMSQLIFALASRQVAGQALKQLTNAAQRAGAAAELRGRARDGRCGRRAHERSASSICRHFRRSAANDATDCPHECSPGPEHYLRERNRAGLSSEQISIFGPLPVFYFNITQRASTHQYSHSSTQDTAYRI